MNNMTIRPATQHDAPLLALVACMALDYDESHPLYPVFLRATSRTDTQHSYCNAFVAEVDNVAVGAIIGYDGAMLHQLREPLLSLIKEHTGQVMTIEDETSAGEFYIDSFAILPSFRSRGIGRLLLHHMRDYAFSIGHERVGLLVDCQKTGTEAFYASMGFRRIDLTSFLGFKMWHMQATKR